MPNVLVQASLIVAKASTNMSSNVSPFDSLSLNSSVFALNSLSLNLEYSSFNAYILSANNLNFFISLYS